MNALFFIPPVELSPVGQAVDRVYGCNYGYDYKPPIHFLQLATVAATWLGWTVRLVDCPAEGIDLAGFEALVRGSRWDVAVAHSVYLSADEDLLAMRRVRAANPGLRAVFMGTAATWRPAEFLDDADTYCLLGEPEVTLRELDEAWRGVRPLDGLAGLARRLPDGTVVRGDFRPLLDVSALPMPDRTLLRGHYRANRLDVHPITSLVVSRGCGFRCTFCTPNAIDQMIELEFKRLQPTYVQRPPLRKRTVDQIVAEFEQIAALGYKGVEVADNIFTWGKQRTIEICERIAPLGLQWLCLARANMLHDPAVIQAMARAGCQLVYMGSESFDDGLLDDIAKDLKVRDVFKAVETCRANGVHPEVSVLMGASRYESWRTLYNSFRAARGLGTRFVHFSVALPSPSTELYDIALAEGWFTQGDFFPVDNQRDAIVNLPNLSARELKFALKLAYIAQYLSPDGLMKSARSVSGVDDLKHKARSAVRLFRFLGSPPPPRRVPPGRVTSPVLHPSG